MSPPRIQRRIEWINAHGEFDGRPFVYLMFGDKPDRPLYVGMSEDIVRRFSIHREKKPWWSDVRVIKVQAFDTAAEAHQHERDLIRATNPVHNFVRYESGS